MFDDANSGEIFAGYRTASSVIAPTIVRCYIVRDLRLRAFVHRVKETQRFTTVSVVKRLEIYTTYVT